jgi:hypothetical protein
MELTMKWQEMLTTLDASGVVEFGIHQMDLKSATPKWRRHRGGPQTRFQSIRSALFSPDKGARVACLGRSTYARKVYAAGLNSIVPYVGVWLHGSQLAFLVRAAAAEPEVVLVPASELNAIQANDDQALLSILSDIFGRGALQYGVRLLASGEVRVP